VARLVGQMFLDTCDDRCCWIHRFIWSNVGDSDDLDVPNTHFQRSYRDRTRSKQGEEIALVSFD
jgi:hypothetical protein